MSSAKAAKPLPVYLQIAELLARQIKAGYWHSGERLPTEAELAQTLSVAVGTLRKSLALLEEQGVLERIQGSGTYVRQTQGTQQIYELFRLELADGPGLPTAQILDLSLQEHPQRLREGGETWAPMGNHCWRVRRLRFLSQVPVALEEIWFSAAACPDLTLQEVGDSMYLFYQQRLSVWIARVEDQISAAPAPVWAVQPLGRLPGECCGYIERVSWTSSNQVAEFSKTWFDPAVCRYSSRMSQ
ncbi:GntR family transcriptional regulator [Limnohabitans planktonicus]|uniref:GntR family transcriptional regulator n=1 Tax=Limnohabitans planktonicus II-D5 TaxID=1293045 RepID=A0A2T7UHV6_9BURK|nr:GntR family transcriptional regulator [Limnohabitans planktonicus]PVE44270.1 GntR family transcriptional regulator [Limnohabitans planktonicus II-D5]